MPLAKSETGSHYKAQLDASHSIIEKTSAKPLKKLKKAATTKTVNYKASVSDIKSMFKQSKTSMIQKAAGNVHNGVDNSIWEWWQIMS